MCVYVLCVYVQKKEASIKHRYVLEEMKCEELLKQKAEKAEQRKETEAKLHTVKWSWHVVIINIIFHWALIFLKLTL